MATIKDIAAEAGVGVGTASRALSGAGHVHPDTKKKIVETAKKYGYVPNQIARNFKKQSTKCIALIIPTVIHPFFSNFAYYCEYELYKLGYCLIIVNSQYNKEKEAVMLEMIKQQRVDGIMFVTHYEHENLDPSLPLVSVDRHLGNGITYITSDNYASSCKAVRKLIESGARKIGCVCGQTKVESETRFRYMAYNDVMAENGLEPMLFIKQFHHGDELSVMREYFDKYPETDALFTGSDMLAQAAWSVAHDRGISVPSRLQIIGYDGILKTSPKLTVVRQNIAEMARCAVEQLMLRLNGKQAKQKVEVPAELVIGETTKEQF